MKKGFVVIGILFLFVLISQAQELTLDDIMNKHYQAVEMDKQLQVNTIIMTGLRVTQDVMPMKIIRKRPDLFMMEFDVADLTTYQAYDGEIAWMTYPWTGNPAPQLLPESRTRDLKYNSDFNGILYKWQEKGHHLDLEGIDTLETGTAYKIKLLRADSAIQYYFIDTQDFLLKKRLSFRKSQGQEIPIEIYFRDYREVEGIPFAFLVETLYSGRSVETEIETIELNVPVSDSIFSMP